MQSKSIKKSLSAQIADYPPLPAHPTGLECRSWANDHPASKTINDQDILSRIAFLQSIDKACQGGAYESYKKIAEHCNCDRRTVIRRINRYVDLGVIIREKRKRTTVDVYTTCVLTVMQEGVTDHLKDGYIIATDEYDKEHEIERQQGGSDKSYEVVTTRSVNNTLFCHQGSDNMSPLELSELEYYEMNTAIKNTESDSRAKNGARSGASDIDTNLLTNRRTT